MFSLHETTRKRTCRTAFFALCLAPTCATAAWIADHHLPWRAAAAARRLSDRYHLDVLLADWQDPRPSMTHIAGVTLAEPGVADPLLKLTGVETHRRGDALILSVNEATLAVADLPALAARLEWSLTRTAAEKIELHVNILTLQKAATAGRGLHADQAQPVTLHQLHGVIERDQHDQPRLQLIAHVAEQPAAEVKPIGLTVAPAATPKSGDEASGEQKRVAPPRGQVIKLNTQQNAIPVALLAPLVPGMAALNDAATFTGVVTWRPTTTTDVGMLHGQLANINLAAMLPPGSQHTVEGAATIDVTDCRWEGEQLQQISGVFSAADAKVSGSFLLAAEIYLNCPLAAPLQHLQAVAARFIHRQTTEADEGLLSAVHQLDHFACRFELSGVGLSLEARIPAASTLPAGALASIGDHALLFSRPLDQITADATPANVPSKLPAVAWLQFIASPPGPGQWIPFTPATLETARRLPVPQ